MNIYQLLGLVNHWALVEQPSKAHRTPLRLGCTTFFLFRMIIMLLGKRGGGEKSVVTLHKRSSNCPSLYVVVRPSCHESLMAWTTEPSYVAL